MKKTFYIGVVFVAVALSFVAPRVSYAEESYVISPITPDATIRWNNENWFTLPHPKPASFAVRDDGSAYGMTETGIPFSQDNVPNELGLRIQMFTMQDHYHYIIEGVAVYTLQEFSQELAISYQNTLT